MGNEEQRISELVPLIYGWDLIRLFLLKRLFRCFIVEEVLRKVIFLLNLKVGFGGRLYYNGGFNNDSCWIRPFPSLATFRLQLLSSCCIFHLSYLSISGTRAVLFETEEEIAV